MASEEMVSIAGTNGQLVVIAAHRYALGRMSYIVGSVVDWLLAYRDRITEETKYVMVRDTVEALDRDCAGMDCDRKEWWKFVKTMIADMSEERRISAFRDARVSEDWRPDPKEGERRDG